MLQYDNIKKKYPDAILLFRVGDFYETFGKDAVETAAALGITLTKRHNGAASEIELAGFPHHALDMYLPKLVRAGYRVAICDQLEDASKAKKIVKRGVTEVVTPGIALSEKLLDHKTNNYLCSVFFGKKKMGVAFADVSTGEFFVSEGSIDYIDKLLQSLQPAEIILSKDAFKKFTEHFGDTYYTYQLEDWVFAHDYSREILLRHFQTQTLKGFGIDDLYHANIAAGSIIHYLSETQHPNLQHISSVSQVKPDRYVWLDKFTIRNLELLYPSHESGTPLIKVLDKTISPMGGRLLKKWTALPLKHIPAIQARLSVVRHLLKHEELADLLAQYIRTIGDVERLIARVPLGKINPRQVFMIKKALSAIAPIKAACLDSENPQLQKIGEQLNPCKIIHDRIDTELVPDPPVKLDKGGVIANGVNSELDDLRYLQHAGKDELIKIQQREIENTGIASLKIGFNNVFGYYLEVRHKYKEQVPQEWVRKQTLVGSERYITQELKVYEEKIFSAEEKILILENDLFNRLVAALGEYIRPIQLNASLIARLDCLLSFAKVAQANDYCEPSVNDTLIIDIKQGRHPVIEQQMPLGENYVPNDIYLNSETQQILLLTGPNMSGKSALLRQTALIVLLAQMGSYVPAHSADIGLVDKIFTRVGASDNISSGESTFMVEMNETASIMNNISERSLILLDEIGRGTSTYDGISIAWALAEYLHHHTLAKPKTLFATHYHELTELAEKFDRIKNYTIAIREAGDKVIFLRKLIPGAAEKSFGIHVARMAGMPKSIVKRAHEVLAQLEVNHEEANKSKEQLKKLPKQDSNSYQLNIFEVSNPKLKKLQESIELIDINQLTPVEALIKLNELKQIIEE